MAIATSRVNARGYKTVYTVPTGKRAVVNAIVHALSAFKMRLGISSSAVSDYTAPVPYTYASDAVGDITKRTAAGGPSPSADNSWVGAAVAMSKDGLWAVIGKPFFNGTQGRFEVWRYISGAWTFSQEIIPNGVTTNWYAACEVTISSDGTYIAVAGTYSASNRVWVYVRSGTTYSLQQEIGSLFNSFSEPGSGYGWDKYLSFSDAGDMLAIGDVAQSTYTGRVHIYTRTASTWSIKGIIDNPALTTNTYFGNSLHLSGSGTRIVIGRAYDSVTANSSGAVVVMTTSNGGSTWTVEQTIKSPNVGASFYFGGSVGMDTAGERIVVGEYGATNSGSSAGKAYVYLRTGTTWALEATFSPNTAGTGYVGASVDMSGDGTHCLIGEPGTGTVVGGQALLYQRSGTTWTLVQTIRETTGANNGNRFGWSVALGNDPRGNLPAIPSYTGTTAVAGISTAVQPVTWVIGVPQGDAYTTDVGNFQFGSNYSTELSPRTAKITAINAAIESDVATQLATLAPNLIDQTTISVKSTWERTGLVLDAGESLIVASEDYTGDANVQLRGFVENV
jgi:hypothetical protein